MGLLLRAHLIPECALWRFVTVVMSIGDLAHRLQASGLRLRSVTCQRQQANNSQSSVMSTRVFRRICVLLVDMSNDLESN
jgi:hypothetical protein